MKNCPLIFIHIHKTAGTTFHDVVQKHFRQDQILFLHGTFDLSDCAASIQAAQAERSERIEYIAGHFPFGLHKHLGCEQNYVTFLRDPVERVFSHYHFLRQARVGGYYLQNRNIERCDVTSRTLAEFLESGLFYAVDNGQVRALSGVGNSVPYGKLSGEHLQMAIENGSSHIRVTGITEKFDESLYLMRKVLDWPKIYYRVRHRNTKKPCTLSADDRKVIEPYTSLDEQLYQAAIEKFHDDLNQYKSWRSSVKQYKYEQKWIYTPITKTGENIIKTARTIKYWLME